MEGLLEKLYYLLTKEPSLLTKRQQPFMFWPACG
jgi:hypothetical protein